MPTHDFYIYSGAALPYDPGTGTFTFDPDYDHTEDRVHLSITDDDQYLDGDEKNDEVGEDANQTGVATKPDGTLVGSGKIYAEQYAVLQAPDGSYVYIDRIEIDGQLIGYSPSEPLTPGVTYTYAGGRDVDNALGGPDGDDTRMTYSQYQAQSVECFGPGTCLRTPTGPRPVEDLEVGDLVDTLDHGARPIRWIGRTHLTAADIARDLSAAPYLLEAPGGPLVLSANHRVLWSSQWAELMFGEADVLVAVKHLEMAADFVDRDPDGGVTYTHVMFDKHEIVCASGLWVESLLDGPMGQAGLPRLLRQQVQALARRRDTPMQAARLCLTAREAQVLQDAARDRAVMVAAA